VHVSLLMQAGHGVVDPLRQRERAPPIRARDTRRTSFADRRDEVVDLAPQRLAVGHRYLAALDGRLRAWRPPEAPRLDLAAGVVHRDVHRGLHEPDLADALAADAAGRDVRDAAAREAETGVGDVDTVGEDGHADGLDIHDV